MEDLRLALGLLQKRLGKRQGLLPAPALQPQNKLVPVQAQRHHRAAGFFQPAAMRPDQGPQLLQNHVAKDNAVFLVGLLQIGRASCRERVSSCG